MLSDAPRAHSRNLLALVLIAAFLTTPSFTPMSHGANPTCTTTAIANDQSDLSVGLDVHRAYYFTGTGLCDWTVPAGWTEFQLRAMGGGGGGGGGSWSGTKGGGGGGGSIGGFYVNNFSPSVGSVITINLGNGGASGTGASTRGSATGTSGGNGETTTVVIAGTSYFAPGGLGGGGANGDTGGQGGSFPGTGPGSSISKGTFSGGLQNNGNGGGGGISQENSSANATSGEAGAGISIQYSPVVDSVLRHYAGGGGTSDTSRAYSNVGARGASDVQSAQTGAANSGSGGGGGHGCKQASTTCFNQNGSAGASGYVYISRNLSGVISGLNSLDDGPSLSTRFLDVGIAPTLPTISALGYIGSVTWSVSPALPPGISFNTSTGVLSGTPTAVKAWGVYTFTPTDSLAVGQPTFWSTQVDKGTGAAPTFSGSNIIYNVPTALTASGGSGTGGLTFTSSSPDCVLSGTRGETVTAQKASGTCSITVTKAGDANWYSASKSATFTMTKQVSTLSIALSPSSPREEGSVVAITATVGAGQTGTVTFSAGGSAITSCGTSGVVTISGTSATCNWNTTASGSPFTVSASYSGDTNYQSVTSNSVSYTIYPSITLSYPGISTSFGTAKTSTPTISGGSGSQSSWSWSIVKASDSSTVSGITINSSGVVSASSSVATGTYAMRVSATDTVGISKASLMTIVVGLSSAANPVVNADKFSTTAGGTIVLTANVLNAATGTIAFKVGGTSISGCSTVSISSGVAYCNWATSTSSGSPFSVTAVYSGDSSYSTATSSAISISVAPAATFTYAPVTKVFGTETSTAVSISGGVGNFTNWDVVLASDSSAVTGLYINSAGLITVSAGVAAGNYLLAITADDQNGITGSGTLQLTITQATTTISLSAQTITGTVLTGGTLGRQVRLVASMNVPVGGSVVISDAYGTICTVFAFSTNGECWWAPANAARSPYALTAVFAGNSNATAATSNTLTNFVWNAAISVSHSNRTVETGKSTTITPTVSGGTGSLSAWNWGITQAITGDAIGGISIGSNGVISVGTSVKPAEYAMVVSAADLAGAFYYSNVTITVADTTAPDITLSVSTVTMNVGDAFTPYTITNSGSDVDSYSIDQSLPGGLSFSTSSGAISGTPTETATALVITLTASNFAGSDTATLTLTINPLAGGGSSITISLTGGANTAVKGTAVTITATVNVAGKVKFYANGKVIGGCAAKSATTSATCSWKPSVQGQSVLLTALLDPTSNSYSNVKSAALNVGVTRRTGRR